MKRQVSVTRILQGLMAISWITLAHAATPPAGYDPAGQQMRDLQQREQRLQQRKQQEEILQEDKAAEEKKQQAEQEAAAGPSFVLKSVRFTPSDYLTHDQLRSVVLPHLDKPATFSSLQRLIGEINALYQANGVYTAVAILPQQKVENGVVLVNLVEGKLGKLAIEQNQYTEEAFIRDWIGQKDFSKNVDVNALERDILVYNRVNDQRLAAELRAGESFGLTDIVISVEEQPRDSLQVFIDNYGYKSNGREEIGAMYRRQQLFTSGDRAILYGQASEGTLSLSASYNAPINDSRWRLGGSASYTLTEVVHGDFKDADVEGESNRVSIEASYLALSRTAYWMNGLLSASHANSSSTVAGFDISKFANNSISGGGQFNYLGSIWQLNLRQRVEYVETNDKLLDNNETYVLFPGDFTTILRQGNTAFYFLATGGWQLTSDEALPGSISWSLGGASTVRSYENGIITGDKGFYSQLEQHYNGWSPFGQSVDFYIFYDYGEAQALTPKQKAHGLGLGVSTGLWKRFSLDMSIATPLKDVVPDQSDVVFYARLSCQCL